MSIHVDGKKIAAMYWGGRKIREAWHEGQRVFSGKPVEVMPATPGDFDARDWLRGKLAEYGENHETVTEIPFEIDSSQATSLRNMFNHCYALTSVPAMDTSRVTDMSAMFQRCESLTTVPDMDTSRATNMGYMFNKCYALITAPEMNTSQVTDMGFMFQHCYALTSVPAMDTSRVTDMRYMFVSCSALTDGNVRLIGKHWRVDTTGMINKSGLTREPFYDSSGQPI